MSPGGSEVSQVSELGSWHTALSVCVNWKCANGTVVCRGHMVLQAAVSPLITMNEMQIPSFSRARGSAVPLSCAGWSASSQQNFTLFRQDQHFLKLISAFLLLLLVLLWERTRRSRSALCDVTQGVGIAPRSVTTTNPSQVSAPPSETDLILLLSSKGAQCPIEPYFLSGRLQTQG